LQLLGESGSKDPEEIAFALDRLQNGSAGERVVAAWALGAIRYAEAEGALRGALDDKDMNVRANAIGALFALAPEDWPEIVARGLTDDEVFVQQSTLSKMPDLTPAELIGRIGALLVDSEDETVRAGAADALGKANGGDDAVRALGAGVSDASTEVRSHVAFALGKAENSTAIPLLSMLLGDADWKVRANACQALGHYRTPEALEAIAGALEDPNSQVRAVAQRVSEPRP
jgi:HEAT repeat protein